ARAGARAGRGRRRRARRRAPRSPRDGGARARRGQPGARERRRRRVRAVTGLYSVADAAQLFNMGEARLRYWAQTGFVGPSVRQRGRFFYTFQDLLSLKTAISLVDRGVSMQRVRRNLEALRRRLPEIDRPLAQLRICSDGDELVVVAEDAAFQPASGQLVMSFAVKQLTQLLEDAQSVSPIPVAPAPANDPLPETAYACF